MNSFLRLYWRKGHAVQARAVHRLRTTENDRTRNKTSVGPFNFDLRSMILILGHTQAGELDLVVRELRELGLPFLRLNLDDLAYTTPLTVALTPDYKLIIHHPVRGNVDLSNVSSAWTGYMPYRLLRPMHLDFRIMEAIQSDLLALVMGVAEILRYSGTIWFNSPLRVVQTSKVLQLYLAQKIGFFIPESLITVDTQMFQSFYSSNCRDHIYKSVHAQTVDFGTKWLASYTQVVSEDFVSEFAKARELNAPPILFQKRVKKEFEVRILYFGSRRWACKIDSQKSNTLSVDWRVEPTLAQKLMSTFEVPDVLDCMCRALLESLGLKVGAFDLIMTEYGWVFLEVNSTPSWNWMNPFVEDKIQKGIALELAQLELAQEAG